MRNVMDIVFALLAASTEAHHTRQFTGSVHHPAGTTAPACIAALLLTTALPAIAQVSGDYRSAATGNWNDVTTWETYNGVAWFTPINAPGGANTVYLQAGFTVTLTGNEACRDLAINNAAGTHLALGVNTLSVFGELACYNSAADVFPVTYTGSLNAGAAWITSTSGKISIEGATRALTTAGRWGAGNAGTNIPNGFDIEINVDAGAVVTANTSMKARRWTLNFGTLEIAGAYRLAADQGSAAGSDVTINSGATLASAGSGTGGGAVVGRTASGIGGALTLAAGGRMVLTGSSPTIAMSSVIFTGDVEYASASGQTLLAATNAGAATPDTYGNLELANAGAKSLSAATTVNGVLRLTGTATLSSNGGSLAYGPAASLVYAGVAARTTSDAELPATGGPPNLEIDNPGGVSLHASRAIPGSITLTAGVLDLSGVALTLGSSAGGPGTLVRTSGFLTGTGTFVRWIGTSPILIPSNAGLFPMGSGTSDRSLWLGTSAMVSGGTVAVSHGAATGFTMLVPFVDGGVSIDRRHLMSWTVTPGNGLAGVFGLRLRAGGMPGVNAVADLRLVRATDAIGTWAPGTGTAGDPEVNRAGLTAMQLGATFYMGSNSAGNPLPLELASFSARRVDGRVELHWRTATETNNEGFAVERRTATDGAWREIAFVRGAGSSNTPISYSYMDYAIPASGELRYRLKQIDRDGGFEYSTTAVVAHDDSAAFTLYANHPNPCTTRTTFAFTLPTGMHTRVSVYDVTGRRVRTVLDEPVPAGFTSATMDLRGLVAGSYRYVVQCGGMVRSGVFTIVR